MMAEVHGVTTTAMPRIPNYYTKHRGKWVTEYNHCLSGKLPLHVLTSNNVEVECVVWERYTGPLNSTVMKEIL